MQNASIDTSNKFSLSDYSQSSDSEYDTAKYRPAIGLSK